MPDHKTRQIHRIVEATLRVLHDEGLNKVSMSKVAAEAGVTRQTVYNYFPDVESIVAQVLDEHCSALEKHLLASIEEAGGLIEKLRAVAEFQISQATPGHVSFALESGLSAPARARLVSHTVAVKAVLESAVASEVADTVLAGTSAAVLTTLLWGMIEGAVTAALEHPEQKPFLVETVVRAMQATISPRS